MVEGYGDGPLLARIVRDADFFRAVYRGEIRPMDVGHASEYVEEMQLLLDADREANEDGRHARRLPEGVLAPASGFRPTSFLTLKRPYTKTFPLFFSRGQGDVDDPLRNLFVSESEWSIHMLRCVKKDLAEFPLFVFAVAFRIDMSKIIKAYNNSASYVRLADGVIRKIDGFNGPTLRGSQEYFAKKRKDIFGTMDVIGNPHFSFTVSCDPRCEVTKSTALSQDGYDVWHVRDERAKLRLLEGFFEPDASSENYHVHVPTTEERLVGNAPRPVCVYHRGCWRIPMTLLLEGMDVDRLLDRNGYNVQRIFEHKVRAMVNDILLSDNNGLGVKVYHTVKEFAQGCPSGHAHGVAWRKHDGLAAVFEKLHGNETVTGVERDRIVLLADSVVSASLSADRLREKFVGLSPERADVIVGYAAQYQRHECGVRCEIDKKTDGCQKHFPRLPTEMTILTSPPSPLLTKGEKKVLVDACEKVKVKVRGVLVSLGAEGRLANTSLVQVLSVALGNPVRNQDGSVLWSDKRFPACDILRTWIDKFTTDGSDHVLLLSVYYASLSTSTWHVDMDLSYQLLVARNVDECFTVDYNPFILEAMGSNMEFSLVVFTPGNLVHYVTKEEHKAFGITGSKRRLVRDGEIPSLENVLKEINGRRELSQAEAFYRVDNSLFLTETNLKAVSVDCDLPHERLLRLIPDQNGQLFRGLTGRFREVPDLFSNYLHANRYC